MNLARRLLLNLLIRAPWSVPGAAYVREVSVAGPLPFDIFFKPDGTKMYVLQGSGLTAGVYEYDLSPAWDISSATYLRDFGLDFNTQPLGVFFNPDGDTMYVTQSAVNRIYSYSLAPAWDVSSAVFSGFSPSLLADANDPYGLFFKPDGTKMYVIGSQTDVVAEYDLDPAWDVASATYLRNVSVAAQTTAPYGVFFKPDGTKMYVLSVISRTVYEYDLDPAWDVSSAEYLQSSPVLLDPSTYGLFFKPDGNTMYVVGGQLDSVAEYSLFGSIP